MGEWTDGSYSGFDPIERPIRAILPIRVKSHSGFDSTRICRIKTDQEVLEPLKALIILNSLSG